MTLIVNNRPEGESPDQVPGEAIEAAALAAGMAYIAIPVSPGGFAPWQLDALDAALAAMTAARRSAIAAPARAVRCSGRWRRRGQASIPMRSRRRRRAQAYDVAPIYEMLNALSADAAR